MPPAAESRGESDSAVYKTAQLLCGQQSERLVDWESLRGQDWLQKIKDFWQGGAAELLERLQKLISSQLVPPEELPPETIGESGAGGPLPAYSLSAYGLPAAEGNDPCALLFDGVDVVAGQRAGHLPVWLAQPSGQRPG